MNLELENLHNLGLAHRHKLRASDEGLYFSGPRFYHIGVVYTGAGTTYFIGGENAGERNKLAEIAEKRNKGFGYPPYTDKTPNYGAISGDEQELTTIINEERLNPIVKCAPISL